MDVSSTKKTLMRKLKRMILSCSLQSQRKTMITLLMKTMVTTKMKAVMRKTMKTDLEMERFT